MAQLYYNGEGVEKNNIISKYWAMLEYTNMSEQENKNSILNVLLEESDATEDKNLISKKFMEINVQLHGNYMLKINTLLRLRLAEELTLNYIS